MSKKKIDGQPSELSNLLACPFCGDKPKGYWDIYDPETKIGEGYNIVCCRGIHIQSVYKADAIYIWEMRAG